MYILIGKKNGEKILHSIKSITSPLTVKLLSPLNVLQETVGKETHLILLLSGCSLLRTTIQCHSVVK